MKTRRQAQSPKDPQEKYKAIIIPIVVALLTATVSLVVAFGAPIANDNRHLALTHTAEAQLTSVALIYRVTDMYSTTAAIQTDTVQRFASQTSLALQQTRDAGVVETSVALTQSAVPSLTPSSTPSFTPRATFTPSLPTGTATTTKIPSASYGNLEDGCISLAYWYLTPGQSQRKPGYCWVLDKWGLYGRDRGFRFFHDESMPPAEKTVFMDLYDYKNFDVSFSAQVNKMEGKTETTSTKLAFGICDSDKYRSKNALVYYSLGERKPTVAIALNGFDNKPYYYQYSGEKQDFKFSFRSNELSVQVGNRKVIDSQFMNKTSNTAVCLYYVVPEGGILDATIENLLIEKK